MDQLQALKIEEANSMLPVGGQLDAIDKYFAHDYVAHLTERDLTGGPAGVRQFVAKLRKAFPDLEVEVEILVESGDRIAWQRTLRGTQSGAFMGFPASHRRIVWRDMVTSRFRDGLIVEDWAISDLAEQLLRTRTE